MTGVMTNLKHIDKQLASLLDIVNTVGNNLYSPILKKLRLRREIVFWLIFSKQ